MCDYMYVLAYVICTTILYVHMIIYMQIAMYNIFMIVVYMLQLLLVQTNNRMCARDFGQGTARARGSRDASAPSGAFVPYLYSFINLSLSLSLDIYIYIYIHTYHTRIYIYIYIYIHITNIMFDVCSSLRASQCG